MPGRLADRVSPARRVAFTVLRRVFEQGAYADRALRAEAEGLDARERALATRLAFGAVQRAGTLDALTTHLAGRPAAELDAPLLAALRLGLYQLCFLDGIPGHAAVDASVELGKAEMPRAAGLVNAVLRRAADEGRAWVENLDDATPGAAAAKHSVPVWLAELWFVAYGPDEARALLAACNEPAEHALRANSLRIGSAELRRALPARSHAGAEPPEAVVVDEAFDAHSSPLFASGAFMPQSRASMMVAHALDPQPGERVLDLCAAPGAKTTHLSALMRNEGEIVAVEARAGRADALRRTSERMGASCVTVLTQDARAYTTDQPFDRVLVDPPCSGLGTLSSRPDLRWRARISADLLAQQQEILQAGRRALRPGGRLVYSTCTLSTAENEDQVRALRPTAERTLLPHRDGTDGFYIATVSL